MILEFNAYLGSCGHEALESCFEAVNIPGIKHPKSCPKLICSIYVILYNQAQKNYDIFDAS